MADFDFIGKKPTHNWLTGQPIEKKERPSSAMTSPERGCFWFFQLTSIFDWFNPSRALRKSISLGLNAETIFFSYEDVVDSGWNQNAIVDLLENPPKEFLEEGEEGMKVVTAMNRFGVCWITIERKDSKQAHCLLSRAGIKHK